jgi:hypothetical protein
MFGMFKRKTDPPQVPPPSPPGAIPPVIPTPAPPVAAGSPPPIIPQGPREHHHELTHGIIPEGFTGEKRSSFITLLFNKELNEFMRGSWIGLGKSFGVAAVPVENFNVTVFRNESHLCAIFEFPPALNPGEAILGLVVVGPAAAWTPQDIVKAPVRYFILERTQIPCPTIKEWTKTGFVSTGREVKPGAPVTDFMDMVFGLMFARPKAEDVARRLLILRRLVVYAEASRYGKALHALPDLSVEAKGDLHSIMGGMFSDTLRRDNLWEYVSNKEKQFFETPVQNLTQQQVTDALWRYEAIQPLKWALGITDQIGPYGKTADGDTAKSEANTPEFIRTAKLRDQKEIERAREIAELWHWRSRTRQLEEEGRPFEPGEALKKAGVHTYADVIRLTAMQATKDGEIPPSIENDFPVNGKPYRKLSAEEWSSIRSETVERHFTLNWLCGYAPANDWDRTPTNT